MLIALLSLPFVVSGAVRLVRGQWEQIVEQRHPPTAGRPIEVIAADLRRLRAQLEARENRPGLTGKGMRMGAVRRAYLEVLGVACRQLEVRPPRPAPDWHSCLAEIYRVEAQLRERGLDVRTASRSGFRAA